MFEVVHTVTHWWDGPRGGVADYLGRPHAFTYGWDEAADDYADTFLLKPLGQAEFLMALEDWAIWRRWEAAYYRQETTIDTHPALPADRARHEELQRLIGDRLTVDPGRAVRKAGEFRTRAGAAWSGHGMAPLEVRWFDPPLVGVAVASFSEAGGHPTNEDAFLVHPHPADPGCWLCVLADGQGGRAGGARASALACQTAADAAGRLSPDELVRPAAWLAVLSAADAAVAADRESGFTTLVGFCIRGEVLAGASCGDSAVLAAVDGRASELTAGQAKNPPVGSGEAALASFGARLSGSWVVLAMSDGVWKYAGWDKVRQAAGTLRGEPLLEALKTAARLPGSGKFPDDFTAVVFEGAAGSAGR